MAKDATESGSELRNVVHGFDKNLAIARIAEINDLVYESISAERFQTGIVVFLGVIAAWLAALGLYSVMSRNITGRIQEIGIRMALGASPANIMRAVLRRSLFLTIMGICVGMMLAVITSRTLSGTFWGMSQIHASWFGGVIILQFVVSLAATYLPSRRAASVDPVAALR
jgi:putative ABC transport system permease protein